MEDRDRLKRAAAERALDFVENGMVLGLGTGSTAAFFVTELAARVARGLAIVAIPTSERTATQARQLGIPLASFAEHRRIDVAIDGADEVQRTTLAQLGEAVPTASPSLLIAGWAVRESASALHADDIDASVTA